MPVDCDTLNLAMSQRFGPSLALRMLERYGPGDDDYGRKPSPFEPPKPAPVFLVRWYEPATDTSGSFSPTLIDPQATCRQGAHDVAAEHQRTTGRIVWVVEDGDCHGRIIKP